MQVKVGKLAVPALVATLYLGSGRVALFSQVPVEAKATGDDTAQSQKAATRDYENPNLTAAERLRLAGRVAHTADVGSCVFSPDDRLLATAGNDSTIRFWNARSGNLERIIRAPKGGVYDIAISPDGSLLASAGCDGAVHLWKSATGDQVRVLGEHADLASLVAFSPDGRVLASAGDDKRVTVWRVADGQSIKRLEAPDSLSYLRFNPIGAQLIGGYRPRRGHPMIIVWQAKDWREVRRQEIPSDDILFTSDGRFAVAGRDTSGASLLDARTLRPVRDLHSGKAQLQYFQATRSGSTLIGCGWNQANCLGEVWTWDVASWRARKLITIVNAVPRALAVSKDGRRVAIAFGKQAAVYDLVSGEQRWVTPDPDALTSSKPTAQLLDLLLEDYRSYHLPFPPATSELSFVGIPSRAVHGLSQKAPRFLAFANRHDGNGRLRYYVACELVPSAWDQYVARPAPPTAASARGTESPSGQPDVPFDYVNPTEADIVLAIQCRERGWQDLAMAILARALARFRIDARAMLATAAWDHWNRQLATPGTERGQIGECLQAVMKAPFGYNKPDNRALLTDIARTDELSTAKPGTVDALIDDLRELGAKGYRDTGQADVSRVDPRYVTLWRLGFDAVPSLMGHLDDRRLTRYCLQGGNSRIAHICDVVTDLLRNLSGGRAGSGERNGAGGGDSLKRADVEKWWREASGQGEENYLVAHATEPVMQPGEVSDKQGRFFPNSCMLHLIAWKYPTHLPELYDRMITKYPDAGKFLLAELLGQSSVAPETKESLFTRAAHGTDPQQRLSAFYELVKMHSPQAVPLVVARMKLVPGTPTGPYWTGEAGDLSQVARLADDPRVWQALEELARRSDVQQRMEILQILSYIGTAGEKRRHSMAFLSRFLDDPSERTIPASARRPGMSEGKWEGPYAGFTFPKLSVRNLVAMSMAYDVGVRANPDEKWTEKQWSQLRERVRRAFTQNRPPLKEGVEADEE